MVVTGLHQEGLRAYSMCLQSMNMNSSDSAAGLMALCEISSQWTMQVRISFGDGPASSYLKHQSQVVMHIRFGREVAAHFNSGCKINTDALLSRFYMLYSSSGITLTLTQSFRNCKNKCTTNFLI